MMKRINLLWLLAPLLALLPVIAYGQTVPKGGIPPGGGFAGSPHDFTKSTAPGGATVIIGACTRCHTPHQSLGTRLLWNHTLSTNSSYSWTDVTNTMGGTKLPTFDQKWTGPTKYCLSCHDGSVASGDVNWYKGGKACFSKSGCPSAGFGQTSAINVGFGGKMDGNHPVAVPYPYGQAKNTYNSTTSGDGVVLAEYAADPTADGIRLFNDTGAANGVVAGTAAGSTGMECTSCHDVHNGSGVQGDFLLRGTLNGDSKPYLCLKCHLKP